MDELLLFTKAMSDANRMKIVALIQRESQLCVCEICDTLEIAQPLVSRYLKQLKEANILQSHKKGKWIIYAISEVPSNVLQAYLQELKKIELKPLCSCGLKERG